ncbi:MAG: hypothetical protein ABEJ31_13325 [Haloarculaceae archaeon]
MSTELFAVGAVATEGPALDPGAVLTVVAALGFASLLGAVGVVLFYLLRYRNAVLAAPYRKRWRYLAVGIGAIGVYAVAGLAETVVAGPRLSEFAHVFRLGATLFAFVFTAVAVRAMYRTATGDRGALAGRRLPARAVPATVGAVVAAWWLAYLFGPPALLAAVETVGLAGAVTYTLVFAVATVREQEGTSIAAVTRHVTPALVAFAGVVVAEQVLRYGFGAAVAAAGVALVGRVLVAAFLFATAVALRQQGGEVSRLYDPTTYRGPRTSAAEADD